MSFLGMIVLILIVLFVILIYFIVTGIKQKNWKRILFSIVGFILIVGIMYYGLITLITSM